MGAISGSRFSSELQVRPDDIDMNHHVHASKYFDYVLAARYDQMARCYKMGMEEFVALGLGWFVRTSHIEYKRPLKLGESFLVTTWIDEITDQSVRVQFEITKKANSKLSADGYCVYTLVNLQTGRAENIPAEITQKYSV
ncbi:MAG TPA: acyl-CoA thioesterase [Candidatus Kapabacteria bacterium]|nr:acyl-CoA thioesterase [Candidatus Kapabacteria bacterium]